MSFKELIEQLNLNTDASTAEKLKRLKRWSHENISQDIKYTGNTSQQYQNYYNLASLYLDELLAAIPENLYEKRDKLDGLNAIQFAAAAGMDQLIRSLAPDAKTVNLSDSYLMTPLHQAASAGHYHTVKALCDLGADPGRNNNNEQPPIFSALMLPMATEENLKSKKIKIFKYLKKQAPHTLKQQDDSGDTLLHWIASYGYPSLIKEVLASNPELFTTPNNHNRYPVHTAILDNQIECLKNLLSISHVERLTDANGETALHYAARYGSKEIVSLCCKAFKNIDILDETGKTPLMAAAEYGNIEAMEALMAKGSDATLMDHFGNTLLHQAVHYYDPAPMNWILDNIANIDINAQNDYGQTALNICLDRQEEDKINLLREHGAANGVNLSK